MAFPTGTGNSPTSGSESAKQAGSMTFSPGSSKPSLLPGGSGLQYSSRQVPTGTRSERQGPDGLRESIRGRPRHPGPVYADRAGARLPRSGSTLRGMDPPAGSAHTGPRATSLDSHRENQDYIADGGTGCSPASRCSGCTRTMRAESWTGGRRSNLSRLGSAAVLRSPQAPSGRAPETSPSKVCATGDAAILAHNPLIVRPSGSRLPNGSTNRE